MTEPVEDELGAALVDLTMPDVSGYEIARSLRRRRPALPIVIMSGFDRDDSLGDGASPNELPFLQKPFSRSQLLAALSRARELSPTRPASRPA